MNKILIIGSINVDLLFSVRNFPKVDQTVLSDSFNQTVGGKGFNQAISCKKFGLNIDLLAKIGNDLYGEMILNQLEGFGFTTNAILKSPNKKSGLASIYVNKSGCKEIVVLPGANYDLLPSDIDLKINLIQNSEIVVSQLELPLITIEYLLIKAKQFNKITILNACPGRKLTKKILNNTDYLIINSLDLELISNIQGKTEEMINQICLNFNGNLIVKDLNKGFYYLKDNQVKIFSTKTQIINSVLEDDIFIACFVYCINKKMNLELSIRVASNVTNKIIESNLGLESLDISILENEINS